jgi:hypothetical protein
MNLFSYSPLLHAPLKFHVNKKPETWEKNKVDPISWFCATVFHKWIHNNERMLKCTTNVVFMRSPLSPKLGLTWRCNRALQKLHHCPYLQGIGHSSFLLTTCPKKFMYLFAKAQILGLSLKFTSPSLPHYRFSCFRCSDQKTLCTLSSSTKTLKNYCIHSWKTSIIV